MAPVIDRLFPASAACRRRGLRDASHVGHLAVFVNDR